MAKDKKNKKSGSTDETRKDESIGATPVSPEVQDTAEPSSSEFQSEELKEVDAVDAEELAEGEKDANYVDQLGENLSLRGMMDANFIEYASYVIKERAIPDVDDGLKPVQRRILWSLYQMDDGKFHKVANVIGHTMQYHPHGDASIGEALVVVANREYFIEKQGNFGNILTGDAASAARYIECRLSKLGLEVLFNNDITEFTDSYDGRNREPVTLPVKIPGLLMLGAEGIAVGMSTKIMPHNFNELLNAQIACLKGESFQIYPDFLQGGIMDVSEYDGGNGKVKVRAKIDMDGRKLIIREVPASTTTESLIASIERAAERSKIKIASINDYTAEHVEIEIVPTRGQDPEKTLKALYTYTDCSVSISVNMMVICENRPAQMDVDSIIRRNTRRLLDYLRLELEIELAKQEELFHAKTLAQIFIENRIYKRIEECESLELVMNEIRRGLEPFADQLKREVTDDDIQKLLAIQIRRISLFDIRKNQEELAAINIAIKQLHKNLKQLRRYAIGYLQDLLDKYGTLFPRRTRIEEFETIDRRAVALNNIKVGWDRKNGYIGVDVKSDDTVTCNEFDHLLCIERQGKYRVINIPEKIYIGRLYDFRKFDTSIEFGVIYRENKSKKYYAKRTVIDKFITDKQYALCPKGCRLELLTPRSDSIYEIVEEIRRNPRPRLINLQDFPTRSPAARGLLLSSKIIQKITHSRYLTEDDKPIETPNPEMPDDKPSQASLSSPELEKISSEASNEHGASEQSEEQPGKSRESQKHPEDQRTGQSKITPELPQNDKKTSPPDNPLTEIAQNPPSDDRKPSSSTGGNLDKNQEGNNIRKASPGPRTTPRQKKTIKEKTEPKSPANTAMDDNEDISSLPPGTDANSHSNTVKIIPRPDNNRNLTESSENDDDEWGIVQPELGF